MSLSPYDNLISVSRQQAKNQNAVNLSLRWRARNSHYIIKRQNFLLFFSLVFLRRSLNAKLSRMMKDNSMSLATKSLPTLLKYRLLFCFTDKIISNWSRMINS
jgi:hypothetical protein